MNKTAKNLNNDIKRYKNITPEILKGLKKLTTGYTTLYYDFANKNKLFNFITTSERIDLDYEFKITREFTIESVTNLVNKINEYGELAKIKINAVSGEIDRVAGEI